MKALALSSQSSWEKRAMSKYFKAKQRGHNSIDISSSFRLATAAETIEYSPSSKI